MVQEHIESNSVTWQKQHKNNANKVKRLIQINIHTTCVYNKYIFKIP